MKIIEKIEIKNFRSLKKIDLDFDSSVSILSGVNSCGKTNILRVLNLFFNDEVGFGKKLSVSDFYNTGKTSDFSTSSISIKVFFNSYASDLIKKQKKIPEKFAIKKDYYYRSGFFSQTITYFDAKGGHSLTENQKQYCDDFLTKWVRFHYIPTDRKVFFKKIHNELSEFLGSPYGYRVLKSQFDDLKINFNTIESSLNTRDLAQLELSDALKNRLEITKVGYALPEVHNLLKVLDFVIEKGSGDRRFVSTEGDGIKFINLLQILDIFDSRYLKESRTRPYASIWAIDEPENSLEQKNIELFKKELWDRHSTNKQIFLTTHSPEFLLEPDKIGRNKFYGFENISGETREILPNSTAVARLPFTGFERQMLINTMGIGMTREEKISLNKEIQRVRAEYESTIDKLKKPKLYSEGNNVEYLKKAKQIFAPDLDIDIESFGGKNELVNFFYRLCDNNFSRYKILFLFDCDAKIEFESCKKLRTNNVIPLVLEHNASNSIVKSGIENLFADDLFKDNAGNLSLRFFPEISINKGSDEKNIKTRDKKLTDGKNGTKKDFQKYICEERGDKNDFVNFELLFVEISKELKN